MAEISLLELQDSGGLASGNLSLGFMLPAWESPDYPPEGDVRRGIAYAMGQMEGEYAPYRMPLETIDITPKMEVIEI